MESLISYSTERKSLTGLLNLLETGHAPSLLINDGAKVRGKSIR